MMRPMVTIVRDQLTERQREALKLMRGRAIYTLLYGGARSGKSFIICRKILHRAKKYEDARFLIARLRFSHAKTSIWNQTLVPMLQHYLPMDDYTINRSDFYVKIANGSEIWLGGFDDKDRTEKILGTEFLDIYFNEVSQIGYDAVTMGLSRLAQNIPGVLNRGYFDCNPPSPLHWAHRLFIEKLEPKDGKPLTMPELYNSLLMNPLDNAENLPKNYIATKLEVLPERTRRRLLNGEWVKQEGTIFEHFDESMIEDPDGWPEMEDYSVGIDGGLNMAAVLWGWSGDHLYLIDSYGAYNATTSAFNAALSARWQWLHRPVIQYCDPSMGERVQEMSYGEPANNDVEAGLDFLSTKMEHGLFHVSRRAAGWLSEIYDYRRDEKERIVKEDDHFMDAGRYGAYSHRGPSRTHKIKKPQKSITAGLMKEQF